MADFLNTIIPNVMTKPDELWESFGQTVYMVIVSGAISMVFGLFFGIKSLFYQVAQLCYSCSQSNPR